MWVLKSYFQGRLTVAIPTWYPSGTLESGAMTCAVAKMLRLETDKAMSKVGRLIIVNDKVELQVYCYRY